MTAGAPQETRGPRLRVAIVGAGLMGRWHAHEARLAGADVVAIVDPDGERASALARRCGGASAHAALPAALDGSGVDVVHVCTPLSTHVEIATRALDAGADVLLEKPLAVDADETERLYAHAAARERLLCPVFQWAFQPAFVRALSAAQAPGALLHVDAVLCSAGAEGRTPAERDMIAADILPHPLSLLERLLPSGLGGLRWQVLRPAAGELRVQAAAGELSARILISMAARPTEASVQLRHAGGTIHLDMFHGYAFTEPGQVSRARKILRPFDASGRRALLASGNLALRAARREWAYPGLRDLISAFHEAVRRRSAPPIAPASAIAVARACDTIVAAARGA